LRIESNRSEAIDEAFKFFARHQDGDSSHDPEFLWRIVCENEPELKDTAVPVAAFSGAGVRYASIGQKGFVAVDLTNREALLYLATPFLEWESQSEHRSVFDLLFCMTAGSLGLTMLSAGCVGMNGRAVLVFGPPNSGKTTSCYLAARNGAEFHADQLVFLDPRGDTLRAWGDFLPAVFRPETLDFLPELQTSTLRSTYNGLSFHFLDKRPLQPHWAEPVAPAFSLLLDRCSGGTPLLTAIAPHEFAHMLRGCLLFEEDSQFDSQIEMTTRALAARPAFTLRYDQNPRTAGNFIFNMLKQV
jgi:hypothetical protein